MHSLTKFKRFIPDRQKIQSYKVLRVFGTWLDEPRLWQFNRHSVPVAFSIGLFVTYIPFLGHMILATFLAIVFRANLPISLALVWVVNPLTMIPLFALALTIGAAVFGVSLTHVDFKHISELTHLWQPFVVGCFITGSVLAILSNMVIKWIWRWVIVKKWQARLQTRAKAPASELAS